ncbi:hypothetical protein AJ79_04333 [Helicocarpus griseus UAMH5409]|uniref:Uncharacterized protein n=1 Tax=Helicocarpus griseus UAMH5409 TaxID=1447875 RepID=A0A2B7XTX0_9EURO|nr:hypothetical protein AJ79_04333 [Helicocarpus griseus UAMH5409]
MASIRHENDVPHSRVRVFLSTRPSNFGVLGQTSLFGINWSAARKRPAKTGTTIAVLPTSTPRTFKAGSSTGAGTDCGQPGMV